MRMNASFMCNGDELKLEDMYKYLDLILTEYLWFITWLLRWGLNQLVGALTLFIAKDKAFGGMIFTCLSNPYEAMLWVCCSPWQLIVYT